MIALQERGCVRVGDVRKVKRETLGDGKRTQKFLSMRYKGGLQVKNQDLIWVRGRTPVTEETQENESPTREVSRTSTLPTGGTKSNVRGLVSGREKGNSEDSN